MDHLLLLPPSHFSLIFLPLLLFIAINAAAIGEHEEGGLLPICRVCTCNRQLRTVECVPGGTVDNGQFRLRMVRLPDWADSFLALNLSQPEFPRFSAHAGLRQFRLLHSGLLSPLPALSFAPFPGLELLQLADNSLREFGPELLRPLGHLRVLDLSGNSLASIPSAWPNGRVLDRLVLDRNPLCPNGQLANGQLALAKQLRLGQTGLVAVNSTHFTFEQHQHHRQADATSFRCHPLHFPAANWDSLEELHLGANPLLAISPDSLSALAHLSLLDLSHARSIPEQIFTDFSQREDTKWRHLDLNGARIERPLAFEYFPYGEDERGKTGKWTTFCSRQMEWLDIGRMGLEGELALSGCKPLKWLYADGNALEDVHFGDAPPVGLLALSLRSNRLRHLPASLLSIAPSLLSLQLANNSIRHLPDQGRLLLAQFVALQQLDLAANKLRHFELDPLPPSPLLLPSSHHPLHLHHQLLFLNLSHNQLRSFRLHSPLPSLTLLDLSVNKLAHFDALSLLPSLEHLHLARNWRIRLLPPDQPNTALVQLDLANCSLDVLPDLGLLYALKELNAQGNRLHLVPAHLLPKEGLSLLDLRGNSIQRIGWDWSEAQLAALFQLRLQANPLDCACPMPRELATRLARQSNGEIHDHSAYFCVEDSQNGAHWQHPLDAFLTAPPASGGAAHSPPPPPPPHLRHFADCPPPRAVALFPSDSLGAMANTPVGVSMGQQDPSLLALFLLPLLLIAGSLGVGLFLLRDSPKWQELHWAHTETGSMLAYEPLPAEQMADSV